MERTWQQARDGVSTIPGVAFRGEAGIGKTRLARAAAELVEESGGTVIELRGSPLHTDIGLHPVRRLLERRCGITRLTNGAERLRFAGGRTARVCNGSRRRGASAGARARRRAGAWLPASGRRRACTAREDRRCVQRYVLACLDGSPGLIIAEDVHWYDPSTIELLDSILTAADGRLLVVLTGREGAWLRTDWPVTLFELAPLTDEESDALIDALNPAVTEAQRAAVRKRCDGVPFYIEHVAAGLDETEHERQVPEALYEPLFARLHAHTDVVPVVEAAAVIGRSGDLALLHSVVEGVADVDGVVAQLVKARVFEPRGTHGWRFRHELLREVASELAPPRMQRELHARVARALAKAAAGVEPDWRVIAAHYERAEQYDDAVEAYQNASGDARRRGALEEALACLTDALNQLARCAAGPGRDRMEIAIRLERGLLAGAAHGSMSGGDRPISSGAWNWRAKASTNSSCSPHSPR